MISHVVAHRIYSNSQWLPELKHHAPNVPIILVGLKADLRDNYSRKHCIIQTTEVSFGAISTRFFLRNSSHAIVQAMAQAERIGAARYVECSAKTGIGVQEAVEAAARLAMVPKRRKRKGRRRRGFMGNKGQEGCSIL